MSRFGPGYPNLNLSSSFQHHLPFSKMISIIPRIEPHDKINTAKKSQVKKTIEFAGKVIKQPYLEMTVMQLSELAALRFNYRAGSFVI